MIPAKGHRASHRGRPAAALAFFLLCHPLFADAPQDLLAAGTRAFASGSFRAAAESFQRIETTFPSAPAAEKAAYLRGVSLFEDGLWDDAIAALASFQSRFPRSSLGPRSDYWLGAASVALGRYSGALGYLTSARFRGGDAGPFKAAVALATGRAFEGLGQLSDASSWYRSAAADPSGGAPAVEAGFRLGSAQMRAGNFGGARGTLARVVLIASNTPFVEEALFSLGECELALGNPAEAQKRYQTLLSVYPATAHAEAAAWRLAECAWQLADLSSAGERIEAYLAGHAGGTYEGEALRLRAAVAASEGRDADAAQDAARAALVLAAPSDRQDALYAAGAAELALGQSVLAADVFRQASAQGDPGLAERAGFQRAVLMAATGSDREAVLALESLRQDFPGGANGEDAQRLLAVLLQRLGDTAGAVLRWDAFVNDYPDSPSLPEALYSRGASLLQLGRSASALDDFQRVMRDFPATPWQGESSYATGYAYAMRGEYPRALQYFQAAGQAPGSGTAGARSRLAVGICLYDMGSFDRAARQFEALAAEPAPALRPGTALLYAGRSLYRLERLDEASTQFGESARLLRLDGSPQAADSLWWLGWSTLRLGRYVEARDAFLAVSHGFPSDPRATEALYRAGVSETMRYDDQAAVAIFDEVLAGGQGKGAGGVRELVLYEKLWALSRLARTAESAATFDQLAREFPDGRMAPAALFKSGEDALDAGRYADAGAAFLRVTRQFPRSAVALPSFYWAGEAARHAGDARGALDLYWGCLAGGADAGLLELALGGFHDALLASGDPDLGRRYAEKAGSAGGLSPDALAGIQLAWAEQLLASSPADAMALITQVRAGAPSEPRAGEASLLAGRYYAVTGDWSRASTVFTSLAATRTDEVGARAAVQRGLAMEAMGRTAEAVDALVRMESQFPGFDDIVAEGLWNARRISLARGDQVKARAIEATLRSRYPQSPWLQQPQLPR